MNGINTYTPYPWLRYFGFLVLVFFTASGYEFSPSRISARKDLHNYAAVPFFYMLKYYAIIAVLYSIVMMAAGLLLLSALCYMLLPDLPFQLHGRKKLFRWERQ